MNINTPRDDLENGNKLGEKTTYKSIQKSIGENLTTPQETKFLTNDEIDIINREIPNSEISKIVAEIIDELSKRIYNGDNPNLTLLEDVVCDKLYSNTKINAEMASVCSLYIMRIQKILNKFPDWENIAPLFNERPSKISSNPNIIQFRKTREQSLQFHTPNQPKPNYYNHEYPNTTKLGTPTSFSKETLTENYTKHTKIKPQYEAVSEKEYSDKFPDFVKTENVETNVPLLDSEDIAIATYQGSYNIITGKTKVPCFDIRGCSNRSELYRYYGLGKAYSFYNKVDDISHIMIFSDDRGFNAGIQIAIKGKVSQRDAIDLVNYLKSKRLFIVEAYTGIVRGIDEYSLDRKGRDIQQAVMEYFNNK